MHGLGCWLRANGHDASVLASHDEAGEYEIDGLPYRTVRARKLGNVYRELTPPVTMIPAMTAVLRRTKPDVVHAFSYHDALASRLAGRPYLISYAGIILPRSWTHLPVQRRMFNRASKDAGVIFCPSVACGEALRTDYGFDYELVPYGLDTARFAPTVATVPGRIFCAATPNDARKRPEFLVDAFAIVAATRPDAHLVFAGAASDAVQARLLGPLPAELRPRVTFLGNIPQSQLREEFAKATVSALTSLNEAFGLVQIESLAAGTPVVGTRSGASPELITDDIGTLFDPDDVKGCARGLTRFLDADDPALPARCMAHARTYDWDAVGPQIVALYERLT